MTSDAEHRIAQVMREALRRSRGYASFFEWAPNRELEEWGVATHFCESLQHRGESFFDAVTARGRGNDPPDCEALGLGGNLIAIEVTELVDPFAIIAHKRKRTYEWSEWCREKLQSTVSERLISKDKCYKNLKGGPYDEYIVLIYTDEPMLPYERGRELLEGAIFGGCNCIDRAFLLISYDPLVGYCPYLPLRISK